MREIILNEGETIRIIGQKRVYLIVTNVKGEIYTKTDYNRDNELKQKPSKYTNEKQNRNQNL